MSTDEERALRLGMDRIRRDMLADKDDALARVEVERQLELEARRGFGQAVAEARAEGHSWEQIVHHVPGLGPAYGAEAADKLFELVSISGSRFGEDLVTWRCGDCDGLVLDRGPDAGHPLDAEPDAGRDHQGAHGSHRPRVPSSRAHLPARHGRAGPGHRCIPRR